MSQQVHIPLRHHTAPMSHQTNYLFSSTYFIHKIAKAFLHGTLFFYCHQKFELFLSANFKHFLSRSFVIVG